MSVKVKLPTILRKHAGGEARVDADGNTLRELLSNLEGSYPGITKNVLTDDGGLHRFINIYVNDEDVRTSGRSRPSSRPATPSRSCPPSPAAEAPARTAGRAGIIASRALPGRL
jgi:molybdopterin converting factor small subunit